jgi:hypothetical protein
VEGEGGRFRRRWFVPVPQVQSLAELNVRLAEIDAAEDDRHVARAGGYRRGGLRGRAAVAAAAAG